MPTSAWIARQSADGTVHVVPCQMDGYLNGVGRKLFRFYDTADKVSNLINAGEIRFLGRTLHDTDYCTEGDRPAVYESIAKCLFHFYESSTVKHLYLYNETNGAWYWKHRCQPVDNNNIANVGCGESYTPMWDGTRLDTIFR